MFFIEKPSFTLQMHPVHKLFGLIMVISVLCHLSFNMRSLLGYLKSRRVSIAAGLLVALLVALYGVAINNEVPTEIAEPMDALAAKAEAIKHGD